MPRKISGGGCAVAAYQRVYVQIQPLLVDASGAPLANPGTIDSQGHYLHIQYSGNLNLRARSGGNQDPNQLDFVPNKIVVEFDGISMFTVPFEGEIQLVGGEGQYKFGLYPAEVIDKQFYQPTLRTLRTFLSAGAPFTVPDFHTYILGANSASQYTLPTGDLLEPSVVLPGSNIMPGLQLVSVKRGTAITGWVG
jgi:hypothetical protein